LTYKDNYNNLFKITSKPDLASKNTNVTTTVNTDQGVDKTFESRTNSIKDKNITSLNSLKPPRLENFKHP